MKLKVEVISSVPVWNLEKAETSCLYNNEQSIRGKLGSRCAFNGEGSMPSLCTPGRGKRGAKKATRQSELYVHPGTV